MSSKPKICLFYCATSYDQNDVMRRFNRQSSDLKVIPMPCSGKLDILYLTKAFETGADGVALMMCKDGDCRYLEGNLRAKKRAEAVGGLIEEAGLNKARISVIQLTDNGINQAIRELDAFLIKIESLKEDANIIAAPVSR